MRAISGERLGQIVDGVEHDAGPAVRVRANLRFSSDLDRSSAPDLELFKRTLLVDAAGSTLAHAASVRCETVPFMFWTQKQPTATFLGFSLRPVLGPVAFEVGHDKPALRFSNGALARLKAMHLLAEMGAAESEQVAELDESEA
ncbi:MAG: hypothetical protein AAGM38_13280 [Pseudomonadota bacterium]